MLKLFFKFCLGSLLATFSLGISDSALATQNLSITIEADQIHNYDGLLEQVMMAANDAIATTFTTTADPIELTVLVNRNGQILPVLSADISHDEWQQQPNIETWARYSTSVRSLLGYAQPPATQVATRPARRPIIENAARIDELD